MNGKDINLGRHRNEDAAAKAYDKAAICARGVKEAKLNYPAADYEDELEYLSTVGLEQLAATLRCVPCCTHSLTCLAELVLLRGLDLMQTSECGARGLLSNGLHACIAGVWRSECRRRRHDTMVCA